LDGNANQLRPDVTLYFIRHGQTDWNAARRYQGQRDVPLNDFGRTQARRNGGVLARSLQETGAIDFVSSPLGRARETMEIIRGAIGLAPGGYRIDPAIQEINYGHWEGLLADELPQHDPEGLAMRRLDAFNWRPKGGESYADLTRRSGDWLQTIARDTVAASHGGVGRTVQGLILGLGHDEILRLDAPQDRIMVVTHNRVDWI